MQEHDNNLIKIAQEQQQVQVKTEDVKVKGEFKQDLSKMNNPHELAMDRLRLLTEYNKLPLNFKLKNYKKEFSRKDLFVNGASLNILKKNLMASTWGVRKNSPLMVAVKESITSLTNALNVQIDTSKEDWENAYHVHVDKINKLYLIAINAANNYILDKDPATDNGKERKRMVENIQDILAGEQSVFLGCAGEYLENLKNQGRGEVPTIANYSDIIYVARAVKMDNMVKGKGGATASVQKVEINGETHFYKDEVKTCSFVLGDEDTFDVLFNSCGKQLETPKEFLNNETIRIMASFHPIINRALPDYFKYFKNSGPNSMQLFVKDVLDAYTKKYDAVKDPDVKQEMLRPKNMSKALQSFVKITPEMFKTFMPIAANAYTIFETSNIAGFNHIKPGTDLSLRNVATNRVANFIGMNDLFAQSRTTVRTNERGNLVRGNLMKKAKGSSIDDMRALVRRKEANKVVMTHEAAEMLSNISILDYITGQQDRHMGNIMFEYTLDKATKVITITGAQGIDNDMSFGTFQKSEIMYGRNRLGGLYGYSDGKKYMGVQHITKQMADGVKKLLDNFETLRLQLADCGLSEEEMENLYERIETVSKYIDQAKKQQKKFVLKSYKNLKTTGDIANLWHRGTSCEVFNLICKNFHKEAKYENYLKIV